MSTYGSRTISCLAWLFLFIAGSIRAEETQKPSSDSGAVVPVFSFNKQFTEAPLGDDLFFSSTGSETFYQLIERIKKARDDDRVKAIVLLTDQVNLGTAQLEELRRHLVELKHAGKEIIAHADTMQTSAYALASVADRIQVTPDGDLWLTGVYIESLHLRGLLDKIHITPDFLTCGEYKSAGEIFLRSEPSPQADENLTWLTDGMYEGLVQQIAEGRGVGADVVRGWIDHGLYGAESAVDHHIIDAVAHRSELSEYLQHRYGAKVKIDHHYGKKKAQEIDLSSPFGVMKFYSDLLSGGRTKKSTDPAIAIVYVEGPIVAGSPPPGGFPLSTMGAAYSTPISKAIDKAAADDAVKAMVLRVNSPGGSAVASEVILAATRRLRAKKPLVVSMGNVAASGGYYVACGAETVFAEPSTLTASIGVVGGKLATKQMWNNVGVTFKAYQRGANAGIFYSGEPFTDGQRAALQGWMNEVYEIFKGHVTAARRDRLKKDIDQLAGGRVYTGKQALELGLVDQLGGLDDAIRHVAAAAHIDKYEVRVLPKPKSFPEMLQESFSGRSPDDDTLSLSAQVGASSALLSQLQGALKIVDGDRADAVLRTLLYLDILQRENVSLHMPAFTVHNR